MTDVYVVSVIHELGEEVAGVFSALDLAYKVVKDVKGRCPYAIHRHTLNSEDPPDIIEMDDGPLTASTPTTPQRRLEP